MEFTPMPLDDEAYEALKSLRAQNRKIIESFLSIKGAGEAANEQRLALLAEDVMYEEVFTMSTLPRRICGMDKVRAQYRENAKCWEDYEYQNVEIRVTQQPDTFLVECDMVGTMTNPMFVDPDRVRSYHNYGFIMFVVRDGKVWQLRLFTNPMRLKHEFWKKMPNYIA